MIGILHIVVARKPVDGTVSENCLKHGTGVINVDGCRIGTLEALKGGSGGLLSHVRDDKILPGMGTFESSKLGRFPANLILDDGSAVFFPDTTSVGHSPKSRGSGGLSTSGHSGQEGLIEKHHDQGSASRFFFNFSEQESNE